MITELATLSISGIGGLAIALIALGVLFLIIGFLLTLAKPPNPSASYAYQIGVVLLIVGVIIYVIELLFG